LRPVDVKHITDSHKIKITGKNYHPNRFNRISMRLGRTQSVFSQLLRAWRDWNWVWVLADDFSIDGLS